MVRGEPVRIDELREKTKEFILNPQKREDLSESPNKAIISLKNDRGTKYKAYLEVYNELKAAYNEIWEDAAQRKHGRSYENLTTPQRKAIRSDVPLVISEAEPTAFGDEG